MEVTVLDSPSLIVRTVSEDVGKATLEGVPSLRAVGAQLCESRDGRTGLPVLNSQCTVSVDVKSC